MASYYSGWVATDDWRLRADVSTSDTGTGVTYTVALYIQNQYMVLGSTQLNWTVTIDGSSWSGNRGNISTWTTYHLGTYSKTVAKGTSSRTVGISFSAKSPSNSIAAYRNGTSGSANQTIGALASHTVSYNANGGSGAPGNQTKWYGSVLTLSSVQPTRTGYNFRIWNTAANGSGTNYSPGGQYSNDANVTLYAQWTAHTYTVAYNANGGSGAPGNQTKTYGVNLTLSSTRPTRTNYNFKGWATSSNATTAQYQPGGTYSANAAVTLYAVWELAYIAPRITALTATRCNSAGTLADDGTYAKVTFNWATDKAVSLVRIACNGTNTDISSSGTSGSVDKVVGAGALDTENSYAITITVTDELGSSTATTTLAPLAYIIDFSPQGGVSIGEPAPNEKRFYVHVPATFNPKIPFSSLDLGNAAQKTLASGSTVKDRVPYIGNDGVMEVGKYIDFHDNNTSSDYSVRIEASGSTLVIDTGNLSTSSATINNLNWSGSGLRGRVMKQLWSGTWTGGTLTIGELPYYNIFGIRVSGSGTSSSPGNVVIFAAKENGELAGGTGVATGTDARLLSINLKISDTRISYSYSRYSVIGGETKTSRPIYAIYGVM